ncbi:AEC family transporter [Actinomycetes bacterium KLBMP 9759]
MNGITAGFIVIGSVIGVGYLVGTSGVLGPTATHVLSRAAFFIATPALLFSTLARADIAAVFSANLLVTAVTSILVCLLYVPVGMLLRRPAGETAVGAMASGYVNAGNLGLPIASYALGSATAVAPVLLFQLAVLTPVFTTILDVMAERTNGARPPLLRTLTAPLRNPIAIATGAGLLVAGLRLVPPEPLMAPVLLIADLAVPAMLLAFGVSLRGAARPGAGENAPLLTAVVLLKNVVHPLLALLVGVLLGLTGHELLVVVVCAALPTAQNVFGYAVRFDQGVVLGRDAALATTVLSVPVLFAAVLLLS